MCFKVLSPLEDGLIVEDTRDQAWLDLVSRAKEPVIVYEKRFDPILMEHLLAGVRYLMAPDGSMPEQVLVL